MLFPPEFLRDLPVAGPHERSALINLKTHRPAVLDRLNCWFEELYPQGNPDVEGRLRNRDSSQFIGAMYEVLIHRYFFNQNWTAERGHLVNGGNPDFYIREHQWCVEVATLGESEAEDRENRELDELCRRLERLDSPFWISIFGFTFQGELRGKRAIADWVQQQVRDHNDVDEFEARYTLNAQEGFVDFTFGRKGSEAGGNVGAKGMYAYDFEAAKGRMFMRLRTKARKYDRDLLIFLCSGGGFWGVHDETLDECLFGDRVLVFNKRTLEEEDQRKPNGFFTRRVNKQPSNRRVSAVMLCERRIVSDTDEIGLEIVAFHNPYARRRLAPTFFPQIKQFAVASETPEQIKMSWINVNSGPIKLH